MTKDSCNFNFTVVGSWTANSNILDELQKKLEELVMQYNVQNVEVEVEDWTITRKKMQVKDNGEK